MFIKVRGYGVQTFAGIVPFATYEYFESEGIDLQDYEQSSMYSDEENSLNIPKEHNFAMGVALNNFCDLWEVQGAILDESNTLIVESDGKPDWECDFSADTLASHGVQLIAVSDSVDIISELPSPTAILVGTQVFKGLVFGEDDVKSDGDFDPKQLKIYFHDTGDDLIVQSIEYAQNELENNCIHVDVKSDEYEWIVK
ncbi:hypothetical protein [Psychrobacter sanguinis]|uniref:Uncharacterized protein n=1 Tax=Psychrobacter sanguinis TaxID=861445 RepID=A0A844M471_9GAMM|nr:hypothetical protein [Psychrobacter sanguinis]MUG33458.1 hypothetical protein [Psychrobacter sanguinis]